MVMTYAMVWRQGCDSALSLMEKNESLPPLPDGEISVSIVVAPRSSLLPSRSGPFEKN